jgi:uncharacterized protein (DUF1778 family)
MHLEDGNMSTRNANINIRVVRRQRDLIDQAAKLAHKTRTSFILDAATVEAENAILNQRIFQLPPVKYGQFLEALDKPPEVNPKLRELLSKKPGWRT